MRIIMDVDDDDDDDDDDEDDDDDDHDDDDDDDDDAGGGGGGGGGIFSQIAYPTKPISIPNLLERLLWDTLGACWTVTFDHPDSSGLTF